MLEKFAGGHPKGVGSLMAGGIGYREAYEDVRSQLELLDERQQKSLILLVACDRIYGFFENRGGTANGPRLVKLVRDLAGELGLKVGEGDDVSKKEAKAYYDELVMMGAIGFVSELGVKNVFCTIWEMINEKVGKPKTE